jgi:hypothetical protein
LVAISLGLTSWGSLHWFEQESTLRNSAWSELFEPMMLGDLKLGRSVEDVIASEEQRELLARCVPRLTEKTSDLGLQAIGRAQQVLGNSKEAKLAFETLANRTTNDYLKKMATAQIAAMEGKGEAAAEDVLTLIAQMERAVYGPEDSYGGYGFGDDPAPTRPAYDLPSPPSFEPQMVPSTVPVPPPTRDFDAAPVESPAADLPRDFTPPASGTPAVSTPSSEIALDDFAPARTPPGEGREIVVPARKVISQRTSPMSPDRERERQAAFAVLLQLQYSGVKLPRVPCGMPVLERSQCVGIGAVSVRPIPEPTPRR